MVSIQSIMLVALGFLSAVLLALMIAPAYRNRAVRLTTKQLKERLPLNENEVRADRDRLRAEYAIKVHKLEMKVDQAKLEKARQTIEIHRRDGKISQLEQQNGNLVALVDENQNARRVLEQTVADRLPKVEARLNEAKTILFNRDREIAELSQSTQRQRLALEEAHSINAQQASELDRLMTALTVRGARNQQALADPNFEGELALRAEIEALRSKTREQAGLIGRLQAQMGRGALQALPPGAEGRPMLNGHASGEAGPRAETGGESRLGPSIALVATTDEQRAQHDRDVRALKARIDDQAGEIARLSAELATYAAGVEGGPTGLKDSKIALKARLNAAQAQVEQSTDTVKRLRAELAAANERLALQGAHFMEQMRRLGAGTLPAAGQTRKPVTHGAKLTLAERVAQNQTARPTATSASAATDVEPPKVDETISRSTVIPLQAAVPPAVAPFANAEAVEPAAYGSATSVSDAVPTAPQDPAQTTHEPADTEPPAVARKPRLIDRIASVSKT